MEVTIAAILILWVLYTLFEYRQRKPDQIVLYEKDNNIKVRTSRYYPRHFSLAISGSVQSTMVEISAEAKGHLLLNVRVALAASASLENIDNLIRAGGWKKSSVANALNEIKVQVESYVKEFSETCEIDEISPVKMTDYLNKKLLTSSSDFGLNIISISTQSIEAQDSEIVLALQQQEEARIKEHTEQTMQQARTSMAKAKAQADEQIILAEHELEMKKLDLRKKIEESESKLAEERVSQELARKEMQLSFEKKEMELLKNNPELLMLSPQLARLAEASQQLPNAKTIVSLAQGDIQKGSQLLETIQDVLKGVFNSKNKK